jgi:hypothetical protein
MFLARTSCCAIHCHIIKPIVAVKPTVTVRKMDNSINVLTLIFFFGPWRLSFSSPVISCMSGRHIFLIGYFLLFL